MNRRIQQDAIILASASPRRRDLLAQAGLTFKVIPSRFDEKLIPLCPPADYVQMLAHAKAADVAQDHRDDWVIGADTVVVIDDHILGKPNGPAGARTMLRLLSGRTHQVLTGYAICCRRRQTAHCARVATAVTFKTLSEAEIEWYLHSAEPLDKAGAYAIQGLGAFLVQSIEGSYTNVVGLPVCEVIEFLIQSGVLCFTATTAQGAIQNVAGHCA